jgi:hypothetical protein
LRGLVEGSNDMSALNHTLLGVTIHLGNIEALNNLGFFWKCGHSTTPRHYSSRQTAWR